MTNETPGYPSGGQRVPDMPEPAVTLADLVADRHDSVRAFGRHFSYDHLQEPQRSVSRAHHDLAVTVVRILPDSPELTVALRKLLEAKDAAVRATRDAHDAGKIPQDAYDAGVL